MHKFIQKWPFLVRLVIEFKRKFGLRKSFISSGEYWNLRYSEHGNSGSGSYDHLAEFKAEIINDFVAANSINSVIEFGCGDGNQLRYFRFPKYVGVDVSEAAVKICQSKFSNDSTKEFVTTNEFKSNETADLTMSLDVIYHLVEDDVYDKYMRQLFSCATQYVIIYSSNEDKPQVMDHVRSRKFSDWVEKNHPEFELIKFIPNKYPIGMKTKLITSIADFYIYQLNAAYSKRKK